MADNIAARGNYIRWEQNGSLLVDRPFFGAEKVLLQQRDEAIEALHYLMQQFDGEVWNCPQCGHAEGTSDTDSAIWLRDWLKTHNVELRGAEPLAAERPSLSAGLERDGD